MKTKAPSYLSIELWLEVLIFLICIYNNYFYEIKIYQKSELHNIYLN